MWSRRRVLLLWACLTSVWCCTFVGVNRQRTSGSVQRGAGPDVGQADEQLEQLGIVLKDLEESFTKSSGPGGQNVNKVETAVRLRHGPSGLEVKAQSHRTQLENRVSARRRLAELYKKVVLGMETKADQRAKRIRSNKARRARRRKKKEEAAAQKEGADEAQEVE
ncbi:Peptide chain release factor 1 (RF-1) [Durusdinium trenchii]|uniref:Peptide chain release factor 1 (RF-1) n=1 Tax=Durusdinium trenchii TaxID=1381693 RepID=A0ABP0R496_9DINO